MKKQYILSLAGLLVVILLFWIGKTNVDKSPPQQETKNISQSFDILSFIYKEKDKKSVSVQDKIAQLESDINKSNDVLAKAKALGVLASYYRDTVQLTEAYLYYTSVAANLDNSEKNLTFAAQLFLNVLRGEQNAGLIEWESKEAIALFEKAIQLNPGNDSLRVGLGSCYVFGKGRNGDPQQTMKGIQELLGVVRKDSNNMQAQLVLGIGGFISGQYDKAIARLSNVVAHEPNNIEAMAYLADTYAAKGMKEDAIKWYNISKRLANDEHYSSEVDLRIQQLH